MDRVLTGVCDSFIENRDMLKDNFKRDGMAMHLMGAALLTSIEGSPDAESLKECEKVLRKHEGIFSPFRGNLKLPVIINMAMQEDPEAYLKMVRKAYDLVCAKMGRRDEKYYLPAMSIAAAAKSEDELSDLVEESEAFFADEKDMDAILAELGLPEDEIEAEVREVGEFLKAQKGFGFAGIGKDMRNVYAKMLVCIARSGSGEAAELVSGEVLDKAGESRFRAAQSAHANMMMQQQMLMQMQIMQTIQMNHLMNN